MPLLTIIRFFGVLLSLVVLGVSVYLLWSWYWGDLFENSDGDLVRVREEWKLWTALVLLAWSLLGKFFVPLLLAKGDKRRTHPERGSGQTISGHSGTLYIEERGKPEAPTIILTHGWALDSTIWFYANRDLGERFRLITWDLPGMGKSDPGGRENIELSSFAEQLRLLVVREAASGPVVLVGHSIGGMTIQTLAKEHPDLLAKEVAGVVLLNTTYTNPLKTMILSGLMQAIRKPILEPAMHLAMVLQPIVWLMAWQSYLSGWTHVANRFGFGKYVTRSQLEHVTLLTTRNSPGNMAKGNLAMFDWDASGAFANLAVPVLVIGGKSDIVTKPEASKAIAQSSSHSELIVVDGVNHMGFLERPDAYNEGIASFVTRVQRSSAVISQEERASRRCGRSA